MPHIPLSREISPLRALAAGLLCVSLTACSPPAASVPRAMLSGNDMELPRAHPGYVQWLEKQSILRQSEKLLSVVSGHTAGMGSLGQRAGTPPLF